MNINNHPCFNDKIRHTYGRIHLPVAPRCNVQCNFCDRKFDCVNESRPGVASTILSPEEALVYVDKVIEKKKNISVIGIAGPGDPFANPIETLETLRLIRKNYPDILLCVSTNGLNLNPYIEELAELKLSHLTITVNAVDPGIASKIYSWIRYNKRVFNNIEGTKILLENQLKAVKKLKENNIAVKINSIIIPGINEYHIPKIAETISGLGADILNCIPLYNNPGTKFENIPAPDIKITTAVKKEAGKFIKLMHHCTRCRADAVGILGEELKKDDIELLKASKKKNKIFTKPDIDKPFIAAASNEGILINQHLGEALELLIYTFENEKPEVVEIRKTPEPGSGDKRWYELAEILNDCKYLLVSGAGKNPSKILKQMGTEVLMLECLIDEAVNKIFKEKNIKHLIKRDIKCGQSCSGNTGGCG